MEITGFSGGIPNDVNERWTKEQNGTSYTFGKIRKSAKHFIYYCQRDSDSGRFIQISSTGFETDRDLTHDEAGQRQQFIDFMNGTK